jgi:type I restriction enzyme R subunit
VAFNENTRVKIPALIHLERLGYKYLSLKTSTWDKETNIFHEILDTSLLRINPSATTDEIGSFKKKVISSLENDDLGKAFYEALKGKSGLRLFDFENLENNTYNCVTELEFTKGLDSFRPDITLLINGLPLIFVEVKKPNNKEGIVAERNRINTRFSNKNFKKIINLTQFMIFSNNMEYDHENLTPVQGAFYATTSYNKASFNCFREEVIDFKNSSQYLDIDVEDKILIDTNLISIKGTPEFLINKDPETPTNRILTSMVSLKRLAFLLEYGITYAETFSGIEKHIMRYPQIFATLAIREKIHGGQKKGIIWHTQGSGKTALAFYNTKYLRDYFQENGKIAKFYFIVDRLDLLTQAQNEFTIRGLKVNTVNSKEEFLDDFTKNQAVSNQSGSLEITVVNIHKFSEEASELFDANYDLNIQRIYFIDEAHRSYSQNGSFLANLISSDRDAILICLTGTPIIGEFASKKIFGDYFHKYYYNASISDGYTLRLIREGIESSYSSQLSEVLAQFEIQKGVLDKGTVLSHPKFVKPMLEYIISDLKKSRMLHNDHTIGGMVVCDSSDQAKQMKEQFDSIFGKSGEMTGTLILHDIGSKDDRKDSVELFKEGKIDILFVFNMLLTGFDAPRLKKLYMGRIVRDHNLLQALTRVNRPYKNFRYGYIVDFADIRKEFDETNAAYFAELKEELGDEISNYSDLFVSKEEVEALILKLKNDLFIYDLTNAEIFSRQISAITDKKRMRDVVSSLDSARNLYNLIRLLDYTELLKNLDFNKLNSLLNEAVNHLSLLNLRDKVENAEETKMLLNSALEDVLFMFRKEGEEELRIGEMKARVKQIRETLERNIDENDPEYLSLIEELRRLLGKGNIVEGEAQDLDAGIIDLEELLSKAKELNRKNGLLADKYQGDAKYVRIHKLLQYQPNGLLDIQIFDFLNGIRTELNEVILSNRGVLGNRGFFEATVDRAIAIGSSNFPEIEQKMNFTNLLALICKEYFTEYEGAVA